MPIFDAGEMELFYTDDGNVETTVVLLHGWACDSNDWVSQIPVLSMEFRVLSVDLRGHGASAAPADCSYGPRAMLADVQRLVKETGGRNLIVIGHSLGAVIASIWAVEHPEAIKAVVLVDPAYLAPIPTGLFDGLELSEAQARVADLFSDGAPEADAPIHLRTWHARRVLATPPHVVVRTYEDTARELLQPGPGGFPIASKEYLSRRICPTLIFQSAPDTGQWESETLRHPNSKLVPWPGAGHWLHQVCASEFNGVLMEWCGAL